MSIIYQLYYTRLGNQGHDAGWNIAAASENTPALVKEHFSKIASDLINIGSRTNVPLLAFDLQIQDGYVFLLHINYNSRNTVGGTDERGVFFIHGFVIEITAHREFIFAPERFRGIRGDWVALNYNGEGTLPPLTTIPYKEFEPEDIMKKYFPNLYWFRNMMKGVYWALEIPGRSLVIKANTIQKEELNTVFQEITCLIMKNMPYHFRTRVNASSGVRQKAILLFSYNEPEDGAWYDLSTGTLNNCPLKQQYEFILFFSSFNLENGCQKACFDWLDEFLTITYGRNRQSLKPEHVELAYHAMIFEQSSLGKTENMPVEKLNEYIEEAVSVPVNSYAKLDEYYAHLIGKYCQNGWFFFSSAVFSQLQKRYINTQCQQLKNIFLSYYVLYANYVRWEYPAGASPLYKMLYDLETTSPEIFQEFLQHIENDCQEFLMDYRINYQLERQITDYEKLYNLWKQKQNTLTSFEVEKLLGIAVNLFEQEISTSKNSLQRYQICKKYMDLCYDFPLSQDNKLWLFNEEFQNKYWNYFEETEFSYKNIGEYYEMGAGKEADPMVPETVNQLLNVRKALFAGQNISDFQNIFFTNAVIDDENLRTRLVKELHEEACNYRDLSLDACLLLNFPLGQSFDLKHLVQDLENNSWLFSKENEVSELYQAIECSQILVKNSEIEECFKRSLKAAAKKKSNSILEQLYQYYFPKLSGKELDMYLVDIVRKCQLFFAIALTDLVWVKYIMGENPVWGKAAAVIGFSAAVVGFVVSMIFGATNSFKLIKEKSLKAVLWGIRFLILLSAALSAVMIISEISEIWMIVVIGISVIMLLVGRLCYES